MSARRSRIERDELAVARAVHTSTPSMGSDGEVFAAWLRRIANGASSKAAARGLTLTYDELQRMADASPIWREALRATLAERKT